MTDLGRSCPRCAALMRPFGQGRTAGWACPSCGEIVARTTPRGYCLGLAIGALALTAVFSVLLPVAGAYVFWALLILLGAVGVAAFVFVSGVSLRRALRNALSPTVRVPAKFVRKRSRDWAVDAPLSVAGSEEGAVIREMDMRLRRDPGVTIASWADCFATFEISGEEKEFVVSAE